MDYRAHYALLINRARDRSLSVYSESHHVVPGCMGGSDEPSNLVRLTPEEHWIAHLLLVKIHPCNAKLIFAVRAMMMSGRTKERSQNKEVGWLRRRMAIASSELHRGAKRSPEARKRMAEACTGRKASNETKLKMKAAHSGKPKSEAHVAKIAKALTGKIGTRLGAVTSNETKQKLRDAALRRPRKAGTRAERLEGVRAEMTPERRAQLSASALKAWITKRARQSQP